MADHVLTSNDDGASVNARPGDRLVVRLEENPTTGYRWAVDEGEGSVLRLAGSDYEVEPAAGIGGGGHRVLTFDVTGAGAVTLGLKRWSQWEGESSVEERLRVTVKAKDEG
jgi:inhibitor of cysteine peptidase